MTSRRTLDAPFARRVDMKISGSPPRRHSRLSPPVPRSRDLSPDKSPGYSFQSVNPIDDLGAVFSTFPQQSPPHGSVSEYPSFVSQTEAQNPFWNASSAPLRAPAHRVGHVQATPLSHTVLAGGSQMTFSPASPIQRPSYMQVPTRPGMISPVALVQHTQPQQQQQRQQHQRQQQTRAPLQDVSPGETPLVHRQFQAQGHYSLSAPFTSQAPPFLPAQHGRPVGDREESAQCTEMQLHSPPMQAALGRPYASDNLHGRGAIGVVPAGQLQMLSTGQYISVDGGAVTDDADAEETYVLAAARAADRAKLAHRVWLKEAQRAREASAQRSGCPLSAKDKERERSRRESAVTRKRAEVYIAELERVARRVPGLERRVTTLQATVLALQAQLAGRPGTLPASPPSDVSPVSKSATVSERLVQ